MALNRSKRTVIVAGPKTYAMAAHVEARERHEQEVGFDFGGAWVRLRNAQRSG